MEMWFDKKYNLIQKNRPFVGQEETNQAFIVYNPDGGPYYGMYENPRTFTMSSHMSPAVKLPQKAIYYYNNPTVRIQTQYKMI
jgi:hypothetical protein